MKKPGDTLAGARIRRPIWARSARNPLWNATWTALIAVVCLVGLHYRKFMLHRLTALYHLDYVVWLKVIAYGFIPTVLAYAGFHLSALIVDDRRKRRIYRAFFVAVGIAGIVLIFLVEQKSSTDNKAATDSLTKKIDSIGQNNDRLLKQLIAGQAPPNTEQSRRQKIIALLTNEYILSHKVVSEGILKGTEQPPTDWVNQRLKQLGENWIISPPESTSVSLSSLSNEQINDEFKSFVKDLRLAIGEVEARIHQIHENTYDAIQVAIRSGTTVTPTTLQKYTQRDKKKEFGTRKDAMEKYRNLMLQVCALRNEAINRLEPWEAGNADPKVSKLCSNIRISDYGTDDMRRLATDASQLQETLQRRIGQ